jgi:hypothetical protein
MSDTVLPGKLRRPVTEAWGDPRYFLYAMLGAGLGVALYSGALVCVWLLESRQWNPYLATPLFAVPLAVALWHMGRIGIVGALMLIAGTTAAHFLAVLAAAYSFDPTAMFATAAERAADAAREQMSAFQSGAAGGAVGAAFSFAFIATLAPGLRDRRRLIEYAFATLMLAALGAVALGGLLPRASANTMPPVLTLLLYVPWQTVFAFAIVHAFKDHHAAR